MKIAFIGLGNMGGGMAANLVKAGHEVRAFDLSEAALAAARDAMATDYQPMTDMRASAAYRLITAQNMLTRYAHDLAGTPVSVLEVQP